MKATVIALALLLSLAAGGVGTMIALALLLGLAAGSVGTRIALAPGAPPGSNSWVANRGDDGVG